MQVQPLVPGLRVVGGSVAFMGSSMIVAALLIDAGPAAMAFWILNSGVPGAGPAGGAFVAAVVVAGVG